MAEHNFSSLDALKEISEAHKTDRPGLSGIGEHIATQVNILTAMINEFYNKQAQLDKIDRERLADLHERKIQIMADVNDLALLPASEETARQIAQLNDTFEKIKKQIDFLTPKK